MSSPALILHDDEPTLALVRSVLGSAGFETAVVPSAYKAVTACDAAPPRLVLFGMTAVDERDMEIVPMLRARWPDAYFVVLYPAALRERAARALSLGADAYLPEPFYPGELLAIARRAAARGETVPRTAAAPPRPKPGGVEQLAAGVAHSIRNPLQILELQIESVEADGAADVPGMRAQVRRIADVLDGLAHFSGRRDLALRPVDLRELVDVVFARAGDAGAAPHFVVTPGTGRLVVLGARELLRAGLESLRSRAVRVTPPGAEVAVSLRPSDDGERRFVEIAVTDGGPPLSEDRRARLFDPYPDAGAVQDGTGLELAGLAGIVRDHGGSIAALPAGAAGTTVVVRLPAAPEPGPPPAAGAR